MPLPKSRVYGMLFDWYNRAFPALSTVSCRALSKLVCAVAEAGACTQPALATAMQRLGLSGAKGESTQVTIRRWLSDPRITHATAYAPLVRETLAHWPSPILVLIADVTALKDRLWRLEVALAYHGRTLALSWAVYPNSGVPEDATWKDLLAQVFAEARALLPPGTPVVMLLDRGFVSPAIWDLVLAQGWHPVLRSLRTVRVRLGQAEQPVGDLLGDDQELVTVVGRVFKKGGWRPATVTAVRRDGQAEAWLLLSDLPAEPQRALEYALRMHIEESFRDDKTQGWRWEQSRIRDPERAARLLLVLHLASLWCLSLGAIAVKSGKAARWIRTSRPAWSLFRIGWTWLREAMMLGQVVPLHHRLIALPMWNTPLINVVPRGCT